ncbi:M48 family metalloprotease [Halomonas sp. MCCC 1A17488]|uniref:M48 family metalloprotease n=1 Tax=unclassified Halomonas TaxID=2609666 RepID=UPI0018D27379|nr:MULTISPECIES: M48 family metalloprotease [unclassified Halomonas]MCE8014818.1 M48 family metalloprotease [Halomonas sp. MCCC 1A17488]MCG3238151.1 M48 family metalloprotease [Halomonas sp. MCCC 1A17488]QPP48081.1 M48 family metalloprotease [Halomonas sp. SS10-MC5]
MPLIKRIATLLLCLTLAGCAGLPTGDSQLAGVSYEVRSADLQHVHRMNRVLIADQALLDYLNGILIRLEAGLDEPCNCIVVVDSFAGYEAYALSPYTIVLSTGVMAQAESEDEIAALLAHELSHVFHEDTIKSRFQQAAVTAARIGGIAAGNGYSVVLGDAAKEAANGLIYHRWNSEQEVQADAFAVSLLAAAGYSQDGLKMAVRRLGEYSQSALASRGDDTPVCVTDAGDNRYNVNFAGCAARMTGSRDSLYEPMEVRLEKLNERIWELEPDERRRRIGNDVPRFASVDYLYGLNRLVSNNETELRAGLEAVEQDAIPPMLEKNAHVYNQLSLAHAMLGNLEPAQDYFMKTLESDYRTTFNYQRLLHHANQQNNPQMVGRIITLMHHDIGLSEEMLPYEYYLAKRHELRLHEAQAWARCGLNLAQNLELYQRCVEFGEAADKNLVLKW